MSRTWRVIRVIGGIMLILLAVGLNGGVCGLRARLDGLRVEPPICLPLDLSVRGVYSGHYARRFDAPLDDQLRLVIAGSPPAEATKRLLNDLSAMLTLRDDSGRIVITKTLDAKEFHEWGPSENGMVVTLPCWESRLGAGTFELSLDVKTPATRMAGHPHCIVAEYGLSGLEGLPIVFGAAIGIVSLLVGIVLLWGPGRKGVESRRGAVV